MRYAPASILLRGYRLGSTIPRWFQRNKKPRPPPLVGTNYPFPIGDGKRKIRPAPDGGGIEGRVCVEGRGPVAGGGGSTAIFGSKSVTWNHVTEAVCTSCSHFKVPVKTPEITT